MNQQDLADKIGCTKDTVSRWERGTSRRVRSHLRQPLSDALRIPWKKLTEQPEQTSESPKDSLGLSTWIKTPIRKDARTSLQLVAERYNVRPRDVLEIAPLLFLIVAERSLLERERRLQEIYATLQEAEERLLDNKAHLGGIIAARSVSADDQLREEDKSIGQKDIFGRLIKYEFWREGDEGPFVHFIRELAKGLPKDVMCEIDSFDGDTIDTYRVADDTLRERTGISEDDELGEALNYIRMGDIDFAECLRVKRDQDEAGYRQWLSGSLVQAKEEADRVWVELFGGLEISASEAGDPAVSVERSEQ